MNMNSMIDLSSENVHLLVEKGFNQMKVLLSYALLPIVLPFLFVQECITWFKEQTGLDQRCLEGKVVFITGASSGIGEGLARVFYRAGCRLILASRNKAELDRVKDQLLRSKPTGRVYVPVILEMDISELYSIPEKVASALKIYDTIDILINNAGMGYRGTVLNTDIDVDMKLMQVNYFGSLALTKVIVNQMIEKEIDGHVVFISSVQGKIAIPNQSAYGASKHAMQAMADSLRAEVAGLGINITVVSPGYVMSNFSMNALTGSGQKYGLMDSSIERGYSADFVAERTFRAVVQREKDVVIAPLTNKMAIYLRYFVASIYFLIMSQRAKYMNH